MAKNGLIHNFYRSLFDFKAYAEFKNQSVGRAFLYLFIISLIFGIIGSAKIYTGLEQMYGDMRQTFRTGVPDFTLTKEGLQVQGKMPMISAEGNKFVTVIDTENKTNPSILDMYEEGIYVDKTQIIFKRSQFETRKYDLSAFKEFAPLTKADVEKLFAYTWVFSLVVIIFFLIFYFVAKIVNALVVSLIGLIWSAVSKSNQPFGDLFKLSVYALTLPIIIETVLTLTGIKIPFFSVIYFGLAAGYLIYALTQIKGPEVAPEEKQP